MDRREFFKLAGIGTIAIAGVPTLFINTDKSVTTKIERFSYSITDLSDKIKPYDVVRYWSDSPEHGWVYAFVYGDKLTPMEKYEPIMKLSKNEINSMQSLHSCIGSDLDTVKLSNPKSIYEHS